MKIESQKLLILFSLTVFVLSVLSVSQPHAEDESERVLQGSNLSEDVDPEVVREVISRIGSRLGGVELISNQLQEVMKFCRAGNWKGLARYFSIRLHLNERDSDLLAKGLKSELFPTPAKNRSPKKQAAPTQKENVRQRLGGLGMKISQKRSLASQRQQRFRAP